MSAFLDGSALNGDPILCNDCSKSPHGVQLPNLDKRFQSLNDLRLSKYDSYNETESNNRLPTRTSKQFNQFFSWRSNNLAGQDTLRHADSLHDNLSSHHSLRDLSMLTNPTYSLAEGLPNSRALPSIPHLPRPAKTNLMFEAIKSGLLNHIEMSEKNWLALQRNVDNHSAILKEIIFQKTFLDRLKKRLIIIERLEEDYNLVLNLREKARVKPGESRISDEVVMRRPNNSDNHKNGLEDNPRHKDFSTLNYKSLCGVLCSIEAQLEYLSGTLKCEVAGLSGFARLCPDTQFEIKFTYGVDTCKWQCRGRINKDGSQQWEKSNAAHVLSPTIADSLNIKAMEVKTFGFRSLLGKKCCEIRELISGERKVLSVWINNIGTLKLSIVAEWCPLADCVDDRLLFYNPNDENSKEVTLNPVSRNNRFSAPPDFVLHPEREVFPTSISTDCLQHITEEDHNVTSSPPQSSPMKVGGDDDAVETKVSPVESITEDDAGSVESPDEHGHLSTLALLKQIQDSCQNILDCLDDLRGQYKELSELERTLIQLETWSQDQTIIAKEQKIDSLSHEASEPSSATKNEPSTATAVESALNAFDFLEDDGEDNGTNEMTPGDRSKTASLPQPIKSKSGGILSSQELLEVICDHLSACQRLMTVLTGANLLKTKELRAVEAFEVQNEYLTSCLGHVNEVLSLSLEECLNRYFPCDREKDVWIHAKSPANPYFIYVDALTNDISASFKEQIEDSPLKEEILKKFIDQLLDRDFHPTINRVSLFQFSRFCQDGSLDHRMKDVIEESVAEHQLSATQPPSVLINNLSALQKVPYSCWSRLGLLLSHSNTNVKEKAKLTIQRFASQRTSLTEAANDDQSDLVDFIGRPAALVALVEGLESNDFHVRAACCHGLTIIQGEEAVNELITLCLNDPVPGVKEAAKETIHQLGQTAVETLQNAQLSKHGFQGLTFQPK